MKKLFSILLVLFASNASIAQSIYPSGVTNCIARWDFASNGAITSLPDVSSNGNNGTAYNLTSTVGWRNLLNKAMGFNGTNSYALVNDALILSPQKISVIALVRFDKFYSGSCQNTVIESKGYPASIPGNYMLSVTDNAYDNGNCSSFDSMHTQLVSAIGPNFNPYPAANFVNLRDWYFIAFTFDGDTVFDYQVIMDTANHVNNVAPIYTANGLNALGVNNQNLSIGRHLDPSFPYWFGGAMDEVAIFNKALSKQEIQSVYDYLWGLLTISYPFTDTSLCRGASFNVNYTVKDQDIFQAGNTFTVQLSDAAGSFTTPTTIGTITSVTAGVIPCTVPAGTTAGTGYKIRIVSSLPASSSAPAYATIKINVAVAPSVVINANPGTSVGPGNMINFTANVINGGSAPAFQWKKNNINIPSAINVNYIAVVGTDLVSNDKVSVFVTNTDGCPTDTTTSNSLTVQINLGVGNVQNSYGANIIPNPNKGDFTITGTCPNSKVVSIEILNMLGQIVYNETIPTVGSVFTKQIFLGNKIAAGTYVLRLNARGENKIMQLTINN